MDFLESRLELFTSHVEQRLEHARVALVLAVFVEAGAADGDLLGAEQLPEPVDLATVLIRKLEILAARSEQRGRHDEAVRHRETRGLHLGEANRLLAAARHAVRERQRGHVSIFEPLGLEDALLERRTSFDRRGDETVLRHHQRDVEDEVEIERCRQSDRDRD